MNCCSTGSAILQSDLEMKVRFNSRRLRSVFKLESSRNRDRFSQVGFRKTLDFQPSILEPSHRTDTCSRERASFGMTLVERVNCGAESLVFSLLLADSCRHS